MVQQIRSYKALEVENDKGKDMSNVASIRDKEKQKEVGIRISELSNVIQIQDLSPSDIELEKRRKEREAIAKRLEIAKNDAAITKMNNKIKFLENARKQSAALPESNVNDKSNNANQTTIGFSTSPLVSSSQKDDHNQPAIDASTSNTANKNMKNVANNPRVDLQRRPYSVEN